MESKKEVMHTPEPWICGGLYNSNIYGVDNILIASAITNHEKSVTKFNLNARRIVACVNACKGIGTETLERYHEDHKPENGFGLHRESELIAQRDELLAALRTCALYITGPESRKEWSEELWALIAKCEVKS